MAIHSRTQEIRDFVCRTLGPSPTALPLNSVLAERFSLSRQALHAQILGMVSAGLIKPTGGSRDRKYEIVFKKKIDRWVDQSNYADESELWSESRSFFEGVPGNVLDVCNWGFTEMVNNAIDHSEGHKIHIQLQDWHAGVTIAISDDGVGIFNKIQRELGLPDPRRSLLELAKGKLTTSPNKHTGEGIFFTSRMFDEFVIISHGLAFTHEKDSDDWLINMEKDFEGTMVVMSIPNDSPIMIKEVLERFAGDEDLTFSKTHVPVKLAELPQEFLVSRSQAKRILNRLDGFRSVVLDFREVNRIGTAFADEIFRVYTLSHPGVIITAQNTNEEVLRMIDRARAGLVTATDQIEMQFDKRTQQDPPPTT